MGDRTVEALNRMIDAAGRDDLVVVNVGGATVADKIVTMLREATATAREQLPHGRSWTTADEIHAAEWLAIDTVMRKARDIAVSERKV